MIQERKYYAISLKHLFPWKIGEPLCLWGRYGKSKDEEKRSYSGYTINPDRAEVYSIEEFNDEYRDPSWLCLSPQIDIGPAKEWRKMSRKYDTIFMDVDLVKKYYEEFDLRAKS